MKFYSIFALAAGSAQAVSMFDRESLILKDYAPALISEFMDGNSDHVDNILAHGCWCAKLDRLNPYSEFHGGKKTLDELDEICRDWILTRNCNDRLTGLGRICTCSMPGTSSTQLLREASYKMMIYPTDTGSCYCYDAEAGCSLDTCEIDMHFAKQLKQFVDDHPFGWTVTEVQGAGTCEFEAPREGNRYCSGSIPSLKVEFQEPTQAPLTEDEVLDLATRGLAMPASFVEELVRTVCDDGYVLDTGTNTCIEEINFHTNNEYKYWPVRLSEDSRQFFRVRASNDAHMLFCPHTNISPNMNIYVTGANCFEIVLGGWGNGQSVIRSTPQGRALFTHRGSVLDRNAYIDFLIDYSGVDMIIYRQGVEFMRLNNWSSVIPSLKSVGVSTGWGSDGDWRF